MLRITIEEDAIEFRLLLEGRLEETLVFELEKAFAQQTGVSAGRPVVIDLSGLTGMDEAGESILQKLYERGATLRCADVMNTYLVERITLGVVKPLQAPCRPCASKLTPEIPQEEEEKESANRDRF